jgi:ribosomal protein S18 acetylase RimI-like enzyme
VSAAPVETIRMGTERARTSFWRGKSDVVLIAPVPGSPVMSGEFVRHCVDKLASRGFQRAITGALSPLEQVGFIASGFEVEQTLVLLRTRLGSSLPEVSPGARLRAVPRWRRSEVLSVDTAAFPEFWRFDELGLRDALRATPEVSFKMLPGRRRRISGYAISGRAGTRGFVQRLAVHPDAQGAGVGRRLLLDGMRWMVRGGASEAYVNTQTTNKSALALYNSVGFREEPIGLSVLSMGLL